MKPYYERDGITIYHADCLQVLEAVTLPELSAVVMDPPYASGSRTEASKPSSGAMLRGQRWAQKPIENDQMTTAGFVWLMREVLLALRGSLKDGGSVLSFIDWRQWPNLVGAVESCNLRTQGMVVWDKESFGMGNGFRVQHELVLHAAKGTPRIVDRGVPNVIRIPRVSNDSHPSPKPVSLMSALLSVVVERGDVICDPFAGCGPVLEAARLAGVQAIGIEQEERYCEEAAKRLNQSILPMEFTA